MEFTTEMLEMLRKPGKNPGYVLSEVGLKFDLPLPCECGCWRAAGGLLAGLGELPVPSLVPARGHGAALVMAQGEPPHGLAAVRTDLSTIAPEPSLNISRFSPCFYVVPGGGSRPRPVIQFFVILRTADLHQGHRGRYVIYE